MHATSGSNPAPFSAEWTSLQREARALRERLHKLDAERGRVSDSVLSRVRNDYERRLEELEAKIGEAASQAGGALTEAAEALARASSEISELDRKLEEFDLRERLGEELDSTSAMAASELRQRREQARARMERATYERDRLLAISRGETPPAPPGQASAPPPPVPRKTREFPALVVPPPTPPPAPAAIARPRLVPVEDEETAEGRDLREKVVVGRLPDSGLQLPVGTVSRRHAELEPLDGGWVLRDLHSENGTWVNGERVWERRLADGDRIHFGTVCLVFRDH